MRQQNKRKSLYKDLSGILYDYFYFVSDLKLAKREAKIQAEDTAREFIQAITTIEQKSKA